MSFESLRHTPEFELPANAPSAPADLISLIEECYTGLSKVVVSKMVRRGKYDQVASIICQDSPGKNSTPAASTDDIAEYCMHCMQYDVDKTDEAGTYKVALFGPPGKGRFERSKHVDLGEGDGAARSKSMLSEGELIEQQSQYIGELHAQSIAVLETLHGMIKPLLSENKEMMKIISESARRLAEVEEIRLKHEVEMKIHNDEMKQREAEEEEKTKRWNETMGVIKESGMVEGLTKAVIKKLNSDNSKERKKQTIYRKNDQTESVENKPSNSTIKNNENQSEKSDKKSRIKKGKEKKRKKEKLAVSERTQKAIERGDEMTEEQLKEVFSISAMERAKENPIALMVEVLRMSIDEKNQWPMIKETLSEEQFKLFKKITETETDDKIEELLKDLYNMKGARRLAKLEDHLDDDQKKYVEKLTEIAVS